jgi:hypothetical protein
MPDSTLFAHGVGEVMAAAYEIRRGLLKLKRA